MRTKNCSFHFHQIGALLAASVALLIRSSVSVRAQSSQNPFEEIGQMAVLSLIAKEYVQIQARQAYHSQVASVGTVKFSPSMTRIKGKLEKVFGRTLSLRVLNDSSFNAACYASGDIFINTGALEELGDDEAAITAILGHEIAHYEKEHSLSAFRRSLVLDSGLRRLLSQRDFDSPLLNFAYQAAIARFSRDQEAEADRIGFVRMVQAGYDPEGAIRAFEKMEKVNHQNHDLMEKLFSTHPPTPDRIKKLHEFAQAFKAGVPLEWIEAGKLTKDLDDRIGHTPEFRIGSSTFLQIAVNRLPDTFRKPDYLRLAVSASKSGSLYVLSVTPDGDIRQIFPNAYNRGGTIEAGETVQIPSTEYRNEKGDFIRLRWEKAGAYHFLFLLTSRPIDASRFVGAKRSPSDLIAALKSEANTSEVTLLDFIHQPIAVKP